MNRNLDWLWKPVSLHSRVRIHLPLIRHGSLHHIWRNHIWGDHVWWQYIGVRVPHWHQVLVSLTDVWVNSKCLLHKWRLVIKSSRRKNWWSGALRNLTNMLLFLAFIKIFFLVISHKNSNIRLPIREERSNFWLFSISG